jgi:hypothetical protein
MSANAPDGQWRRWAWRVTALVVLGCAGYVGVRVLLVWAPAETWFLPEASVTMPAAPLGRDFAARTWVHRVDSVPRALALQQEHRGFEIDVVFRPETNSFDVGHPPTPSINLSLADLIGALERPSDRYYWIDFKNLDADNQRAAAAALRAIADRFGVVDRMVVESRSPQFLGAFKAAGFYTSFYLPAANPYRMTAGERSELLKAIRSGLEHGTVNAVSADHAMYEFIAKYVPGYDILLWDIGTSRVKYRIREARLLGDPRVKILLFHQHSVGFR